MSHLEYELGKIADIDPLYPPVEYLDNPVKDRNGQQVDLRNRLDVIRHYTESSLSLDGFTDAAAEVREDAGAFKVRITARESEESLRAFAKRHRELFGPDAGAKAVRGADLMKRMGVWNPMSGYPVNRSASDGDCKWHLFLPLGMGIVNHRAVTLLHYPPWQALREASYLNNMTLQRWQRLLQCTGIGEADQNRYKTIIDVNPIAAPGSGQSEYPNDYFPIMMSSAFFDGGEGLDYIRSMLELYLNPPGTEGNAMTLPLLVGGSPLYDPQAPGWLRVAFKVAMPKDERGIPQANVLQTGKLRISPKSTRETPYMIANHMIAAGVTGRCCTGDQRAAVPDIRVYEAQDLVAASFLEEYRKIPDLDPAEAKRRACRRWFGNPDGTGAPLPPVPEDRATLCALAQMDLFFSPGPPPHPTYTFEQAKERCAQNENDPCAAPIAPKECPRC